MPNIPVRIEAIALFTHPIITRFIKRPRYTARKPLRNFAGFPEYRNSANSTSVIIPALLHNLAKKNTVSRPPKAKFHQTQFPAIPFFATSSVTASGVSAAKVVATIDKPAKYHGRFLPDKKNSSVLFPAFLV